MTTLNPAPSLDVIAGTPSALADIAYWTHELNPKLGNAPNSGAIFTIIPLPPPPTDPSEPPQILAVISPKMAAILAAATKSSDQACARAFSNDLHRAVASLSQRR